MTITNINSLDLNVAVASQYAKSGLKSSPADFRRVFNEFVDSLPGQITPVREVLLYRGFAWTLGWCRDLGGCRDLGD
jgi:hypothetical protein